MAHKKGVGSSKNGRDSNPNMLGVKSPGGATIHAGTIIVRQRGTKFHPGVNVGRGNDDTLFAKATGTRELAGLLMTPAGTPSRRTPSRARMQLMRAATMMILVRAFPLQTMALP